MCLTGKIFSLFQKLIFIAAPDFFSVKSNIRDERMFEQINLKTDKIGVIFMLLNCYVERRKWKDKTFNAV
jgi:hypothetical protein